MAKSLASRLEDLFSDNIREDLNKKVNNAVQKSDKYSSSQKKQIAANLTADERNKPKFSDEARIQEEARRRVEEERLRREREFRQLQEDRNRQYRADLAARSTPEATEQRDYQYTYGANTVLGKIGASAQGRQGVNADAAQQSADTAVQDIRSSTDALSREVYGIQQPSAAVKPEQNLIQASAVDISRTASDRAKQQRQSAERAKLAQGTAILDMLNEAMKSAQGDQRADIAKQIAQVRSANMQAARSLNATYNSATGRYELMNGQVIQPDSTVDPAQAGSALTAEGAGAAPESNGIERNVFNSMAKSTEQILSSALGAAQDAGNFVSGEFYSGIGSVLRGIGQNRLADAADAQAEYSFSTDLFGADRWKDSIKQRYTWEEDSVDKVSSMLSEGAGYMAPSIAAGLLSGGLSVGAELGGAGAGLAGAAAGSGNAGLAAMAASTYGASTKDALDQGASLTEARTYGALSAIASAGTEKLAGGIPGLNNGAADDFVKKMIRSPKLQRAAGVAVDLLGEGAEEAIESALEPVWRRLTFDPDAELATPEQLAESFGSGVLLSAVLMGGNYAGSKVAEKVTDRQLGIRTVSERKYKQLMKQIQPDYDTYDRLIGAGFTESQIAETAVYTAVERGELGFEDADGMLREICSNAAQNDAQAAQEGVLTAEVETGAAQANAAESAAEAAQNADTDVSVSAAFRQQTEQNAVRNAAETQQTEQNAAEVQQAKQNAAEVQQDEPAAELNPAKTTLDRDAYQAELMRAMDETDITPEQAVQYLDDYDRRHGTAETDSDMAVSDAQAAQESAETVPDEIAPAQENDEDAVERAQNADSAMDVFRRYQDEWSKWSGQLSDDQKAYLSRNFGLLKQDKLSPAAVHAWEQRMDQAQSAEDFAHVLDDLLAISRQNPNERISDTLDNAEMLEENVQQESDTSDSNNNTGQDVGSSSKSHPNRTIQDFLNRNLESEFPLTIAEQCSKIFIEYQNGSLNAEDSEILIDLNQRVWEMQQYKDEVISSFSSGDGLIRLTQFENMQLLAAVQSGQPKLIWQNGIPQHLDLMLELYPVERCLYLFNKPLSKYRRAQFEALHDMAMPYTEHIDRANDRKTGLYYQRHSTEKIFQDVYRDKPELYKKFRAEYLDPMHLHERQATEYKEQLRSRVRPFKLTKHESAAVQMLLDNNTEGYADYYVKHSKRIDVNKVQRAVEEYRKIFSEVHSKINEALVANAYSTIGEIKYYSPHFYKPEGMMTKLLARVGKITKHGRVYGEHDLPTAIAGQTDQRRPTKRFARHGMERTGENTDYDIEYAFDQYIEEFADVIFLTSDMRRLRAYEDNVRYGMATEEIRAEVDKINNNPAYDQIARETLVDNVYSGTQSDHIGQRVAAKLTGDQNVTGLCNFVVWLRDFTNTVGNKKTFFDRNIEHMFSRDVYTISSKFFSRLNKNLTGTVSASVTNILPGFRILGELGPHAVKAYLDLGKSVFHDDGFAQRSDFLVTRRGSSELKQGVLDKAFDAMGIFDDIGSELVVRAYYHRNLSRGMTPEEAMTQAGYDASDALGDRSKTSMPMLYRNKNPLIRLVTSFQLEVDNDFQHINTLRKEHGLLSKEFASKMVGIGVVTWGLNSLFELLFGYRPLLDPVDWILDLLDIGDDDDEKPELNQLADNVAQDLPYVGTFLGGGRVPVTGAIPGEDLSGMMDAVSRMFSLDTSAQERRDIAIEELSKPVVTLALPALGGQMRKTAAGINAMLEGGDYSYDDDGTKRLTAPVENNLWNWLQASFGGKYALSDIRESFSGAESLTEEQTRIYDSIRAGEQNYGVDAYEFAKLAQEYNGMEADKDEDGKEIKGTKEYNFRKKIAGLDISDTDKRLLDTAIISQDWKYTVKYGTNAGAKSERFTTKRAAIYDKSLGSGEQDSVLYLVSVCSSTDYDAANAAHEDGLKYSRFRTAYDATKDIKQETQVNILTNNPNQTIQTYTAKENKALALFDMQDGMTNEEKHLYAKHMLGDFGEQLDFSSETDFTKTLLLSCSGKDSQQSRFEDERIYDPEVLAPGDLFAACLELDANIKSYKQATGYYESSSQMEGRFYTYNGIERTLLDKMDYTDEQKAMIDAVIFGKTFGIKMNYVRSDTITYGQFNRAWQVLYAKGTDGKDKYSGKAEKISAIMEETGLSYSDAARICSVQYMNADDILSGAGGSGGSSGGYRRRYGSRRRYSRRRRSGSGGSGGSSGGSGSGLGGRKWSKPWKNGYKLGSFLKDYSYQGLFDLDF